MAETDDENERRPYTAPKLTRVTEDEARALTAQLDRGGRSEKEEIRALVKKAHAATERAREAIERAIDRRPGTRHRELLDVGVAVEAAEKTLLEALRKCGGLT